MTSCKESQNCFKLKLLLKSPEHVISEIEYTGVEAFELGVGNIPPGRGNRS